MPTRRPGPSRVERTDPPRTSQRGSIGPHPPTDGVENRFPHFPQTRTKGGTEPIGRGCTDERRTPSASLHDRTPARKHPGPTGGRPNPIAGDPAPRRHADPAIRQRRTERSGPRPRRDERRHPPAPPRPAPPPAARPASPGAAARAGSRGQTKGRRTDRWQNGGDTRARGAGTARLSPPQPPSPPPGAAHLRAMDARQVPAGRAPLRSAPRASAVRARRASLPCKGRNRCHAGRSGTARVSSSRACPGAKRSTAGALSPRPFANVKAPGSPERRAAGHGRAAPGRRGQRLPGPPQRQRAALRRGRYQWLVSRELSPPTLSHRRPMSTAAERGACQREELAGRSGGTRRRRNLRAGAGQRRARTKKCNRKRGTRIVPPPGNVVPQRRSLVAAATSLSPGAAASVRHSAPFGLSGGCRNPAVPRADSGEQSARRIPPRAVRWRRHFRRL